MGGRNIILSCFPAPIFLPENKTGGTRIVSGIEELRAQWYEKECGLVVRTPVAWCSESDCVEGGPYFPLNAVEKGEAGRPA